MNGHTWTPSSLIRRAAEPPSPPTIGGLLYPAKRTLISGETEAMKTWAALILAKAEMDAGFAVAWVDLDAMGNSEILARLRALGVADAVIDGMFLYYDPAERLIGDVLEEVVGELSDRGVRLFVIDAFNPMLNLHGLDQNSTSDIETFWREVASPITDAGAAPVLLDHVVKNREGRGKYAIGSERKASGAIVHVGFRLLQPLTRGGTGRTLLTTHKDRPAYLPRPTIGRLVLDSDGVRVSYRLEADHSHADDGGFRPTRLMERISLRLEDSDEPVSQRWVEDKVEGKGEYLRQALSVLTDEGYVERKEGGRGYLLTSIRPYREADDSPHEGDETTASRLRPDCVPTLRSSPTSTASPSPPMGARDAVEAGVVHDRVPTASPDRDDPYLRWVDTVATDPVSDDLEALAERYLR